MANEVTPLVGNDCGLYLETGGVYETPVWTEILESSDVSLSEWNVSEAEIVTRASDWAVALAAKFRCAIEFKYLWGADWAMLDILRANFMKREVMDVWFSDGNPVVGGLHTIQGLRAPVQIRQFPINQPNEEAVFVDTVRMTPTYAEDTVGGTRIEPVWYLKTATKAMGDSPALKNKVRSFEGSGEWIQVLVEELKAEGIKFKYDLPGKRPVLVPSDWKTSYVKRTKVPKAKH